MGSKAKDINDYEITIEKLPELRIEEIDGE